MAALQAGTTETGLTTPAEHNDAALAARRHSLGPQYDGRPYHVSPGDPVHLRPGRDLVVTAM